VSDAVGEKRHRFSMGTFSLVQFFHRSAFHLALSGEPSLTEENSLQFSPCRLVTDMWAPPRWGPHVNDPTAEDLVPSLTCEIPVRGE
jgi:hypothetical protein